MVSPSVTELFGNPPSVFMKASETLLRLADKLLAHPDDASCRSIRVGSDDITELLTVQGAIDCLFTMGFEEAGEYFSFPNDKDLCMLNVTRNEIHQERNRYLKQKLSQDMEKFVNTYAHSGTENSIPGFVDNKRYPGDVKEQEKMFYSRLMSGYRKTLYYEDSVLQNRARQCIPLSQLKKAAAAAFESSKTSTSDQTTKLDVQDYLLMELVRWYKNMFFSWVDRPPCDFCGCASKPIGEALTPTSDERMWDAARVEGYVCTSCGKQVRFPRYNHPLKLLETRRGRCGEWANCFTLMCRSLQFEARLIEDWTDHLWTEVFSASQQRWIHVDSCEAACDQPLTYESGWNKKLTYIIAFSNEEIVDVTWRYSWKHQEVLARRLLCRERWLFQILTKMNKVCQNLLPSARRTTLLERKAVEVAEFMCPKSPKDEDLKGRTSGSLAWRLQRGETQSNEEIQPYTFTLTSSEISQKKFHLQYSCAEDVYVRESNSNHMEKWESGIFACSNVTRKVEHDWKMCYLARMEGTDSASIAWKFDFSSSDTKLHHLKILCSSAVFENGTIAWTLCGDETCIPIPTGETAFETSDLKGSSIVTLKAMLSLGKGNCAWQHTQLFRQSSTSKNVYPLDVLATFL